MKIVLAVAALLVAAVPVFAGGACPMMPSPMNCPPASGASLAQLLLALAAGYAVLTLAAGQDKKTAKAGKILGWFIIVVSFIGMLCAGSKALCRMKTACAMKSAAAACPMSGGEKSACVMTGEPHADEAPKK